MNPVILVWLILSASGLVMSVYLTNESRLDLLALKGVSNGRRTAAWSRMWREALRVSVHAVYIAIALPLLFRPFNGVSIVVLGLMWGNVVMVINSLIDARARRALRAYFLRRDREAG